MTEPLRIEFELACTSDYAFATWTRGIGRWWPREHTTSGDPHATVHLEPRLGGRIYERTSDGLEIEWGEVTAWDPPRSFSYLWHIRRDRADATDVEVTFQPDGPDSCRVRIVHAGWERLGADGPSWRDANRGGWSRLLPHFERAVNANDHDH